MELPVGDGFSIYCTLYLADTQSVETIPFLVGNTIYVAASDGCVYAIDKCSGKVLGHYVVGSPIF